MNINELSRYCNEEVTISQLEIIQNYWQKYLLDEGALPYQRIIPILVECGIVTALFTLLTQNFSLGLLKSLFPFYAMIIVFNVIVCIVNAVRTSKVNKKISKPLKTGEDIKISRTRYIYMGKEKIITFNGTKGNDVSVIYKFGDGTSSKPLISLEKRQVGIFFEDEGIEEGMEYLLYSIRNEYVFIIKG